jgi:SRSO17 transposase
MKSQKHTPEQITKRFDEYLDHLAEALGHADRREPLRQYCSGLLLPLERKSLEPMAGALAPSTVRSTHQAMHHFVADSPWSDKALLRAVRGWTLPAIEQQGPIEAWIIDDTGTPKQGKHSVGVAVQYCGQLGKKSNCQVAVSLSIANEHASLPLAHELYLPKEWAEDRERRAKAGVPEEVEFRTKPQIALAQCRAALEAGVPAAAVLADSAYGSNPEFRDGLTELGLRYVVGVDPQTSVWPEGAGPLGPAEYCGVGPRPKRLRRDAEHQPISVRELALALRPQAFRTVEWREGSAGPMRSRFARCRVRPAHRDFDRTEPRAEEWLLIEWPESEQQPTNSWLCTLPKSTTLRQMVHLAHLRWRIERDYEELKSELGLAHYEGRSWRGFHHHASLCIAAYGFVAAQRCLFPPTAAAPRPAFTLPAVPGGFRPRGSPDAGRAA